MPPAPPTFSTMICWPSSSLRRAAMIRPMVSTGPPAAYGTTSVTGRAGHSCAPAPALNVSAPVSTAAKTARAIFVLRPSIHADAGGFDDLAPALDLLGQVLGEVFGRALLRRHDLEAELFQLLADSRILDHVVDRLVELAHDRIRRSVRQEEGVPDRGFDPCQPLLAGGRQLRNDRHALFCHHGDALRVALLGLLRAGLDGVAHVVDAAADQVLHHRAGA